MAIENYKPKELETESSSEKPIEDYYRVFPEISRKVDYDARKIQIEISMPGVPKANITLKALSEWFHVEGRREHLIYSANQSWGAEIIPEKTTAKYDNGLLKINAIIRNPMDDAREIAL